MKKSTLATVSLTGTALILSDLYRYIFFRNRSAISVALLDKKGHCEEYYLKRDMAADNLEKRHHEVMTITSDFGYTLNGFYYKSGKERSKKIAYIIHGYRSDHADTAGMYADYYLKQGFDVFCDDHVASGSSGGYFIGYDYYETKDCLKWINYLKRQCGKDIQIVLHGFSMGGATVINMSDKCPDNVKFIVCDSGFTSAIDILKHQLGIKSSKFYSALDGINKKVAGYSLYDTDVRNSNKSTKLPILFVHGTEDKTVPTRMGIELYENSSSPDKDMLIVDGARHIESMFINPEEYKEKLDKYIKKYIA